MACCLCFREAVWQGALLSTQSVWNLGCSGVVEAEDQGAMCSEEAEHKSIKESQEQEYAFRESRQV